MARARCASLSPTPGPSVSYARGVTAQADFMVRDEGSQLQNGSTYNAWPRGDRMSFGRVGALDVDDPIRPVLACALEACTIADFPAPDRSSTRGERVPK
jgi:hypothetical protein